MKQLPYDNTSSKSIEQYARKLIEKTFKDVIINDPNISAEDRAIWIEYYNNPKSKVSLGQLIEKHYFFYDNNTNSEADFKEAGVELKVTPYVIKSVGDLTAKERLVLTIINYMNDYKESDFLKSHVYEKCALMLLIYYLHDPSKARLDFIMKFVSLFKFPEEDLEIIK